MPSDKNNWVVVLPFSGEPKASTGYEPHFVLLEHMSPELSREANYWAAGLQAPPSSEYILARGYINHLNRICFEECAGNRNTVYDVVLNHIQNKRKTAKKSPFFDVNNILTLFVTRAMNEHIPDEQDIFDVKKYIKNIANCSDEEIRDCLNDIMSAENPAAAIRLMEEVGALKLMLPEVSDTKGFWQRYKNTSSELFQHLLVCLDYVAKHSDKRNLRWAALLHDIGKLKAVWVDEKGRTKFHKGPEGQGENHEEVGPETIKEMFDRLGMPNKDTEEVCFFVQEHMFEHFDNEKGAKKFIDTLGGEENAYDMLILRLGDIQNKPKQKEGEKEVEEMRELIAKVASKETDWEKVDESGSLIVVLKEYDII